MPELIGRTLGQYRIIEQIGQGGMATVYKAYQPGLDRDVALKILPPLHAKQPGFSERFRREARAIANLHHPNILPVYDSGQDSDYSYLVMRYIDGAHTLTDVMRGSLTMEQVSNLIGQIASALSYAHRQGVIHRDVKPSNVLMDGDWVLLTDFGLAKMTEASVKLTGTGVGMGTPAYMSPEQGQGKQVDHRTDIYALGVILYEMLTGQIPHDADTPFGIIVKRMSEPLPLPSALNPTVTEPVERVILRALASDPADRFDDAEEMATTLRSAIAKPHPADDRQTKFSPPPKGDSPAPAVTLADSESIPPDSPPESVPKKQPTPILAQPEQKPIQPSPKVSSVEAPPVPVSSPPKARLIKLTPLGVLIIILFCGAALFLPPLSLVDRVQSIGYQRIGEAGGAIQDPDGTRLTFFPEGVSGTFRVKLTAIPRSTFLDGNAERDLVEAAESLPPNLILKSPYYQIQHTGSMPEAVNITIPIPNEAEPFETLDLYTWDGKSWEWLPHNLVSADEMIETSVDYLPESVAVVQTQSVYPAIAANYSRDNEPPPADLLNELNLQGFYLNGQGQIDGLPPARIDGIADNVIPTLTNQRNDGSIRADVIDNILLDTKTRQQHATVIAHFVTQNNYHGVDLDYQGIAPELRAEFTAFLTQLRQELPINAILSVRLSPARQVSTDTWDTGAYDWQAIGRIADKVKISASVGSKTYISGDQMKAMLDWAVGQINRYKIQIILPAHSFEQVNGGIIREIAYSEALSLLGPIAIPQRGSVIQSGQTVEFTLDGMQRSTGVAYDSGSGIYWLAYLDDNDVQRTVYLENRASMARKMHFVAQYNLGGLAVAGIPDDNYESELWSFLNQVAELVIMPVEDQYKVVWQFQNEDGGVVAEELLDLTGSPSFDWAAPETGGAYQVSAAIVPHPDSSSVVKLGSVSLQVSGTSTATPTDSPSPTATNIPLSTTTPTVYRQSEIINEKMVLIPAGSFTMGSDADEALTGCLKYENDCERDWFFDEEPVHTVMLDDYWIDQYEVTNADYAECVQAGGCTEPYEVKSYSRDSYYDNPAYANYPVIYIDWTQARTYCEWRGARLPSEAEWEKAARGTDGRTYPWGEELNCNMANYGTCVGDITEVGSYPDGVSPYDIYDMAGNVSEWTGSAYEDYPYAANDGREDVEKVEVSPVIRGGFWHGFPNNLRTTYRSPTYPDAGYNLIGFRCARLS